MALENGTDEIQALKKGGKTLSTDPQDMLNDAINHANRELSTGVALVRQLGITEEECSDEKIEMALVTVKFNFIKKSRTKKSKYQAILDNLEEGK
jgi:thiamine kinase-like enzyme